MAGRRWTRDAAGAVLAALALATTAACSDDSGTPSSTGSDAVSAASSLASEASGVLSSATAEAKRQLNEVKNGVDARDEVKIGRVTTDSAGRATATVTAHNTADATKSFAVQVNFRDTGGNLLDTVVLTIDDVVAGKSAEGTARSNRKLSGQLRAEIAVALRY
ncbi:hypothetical protein ABT301_14995 [Streptomyces sp. NPDC000987]|uniref:hypothetical protein n=1 Tax=Streptomyces sp. NPDC000987 TaxID=3154374 RepID=UPI0033182BE5